MSPINVLVIFHSRSGSTETLALAAAVGAVQARANIRLRRLPDFGEDAREETETLARMRKEYVPPGKTDALWADAVIIALDGKIAGIACDPVSATDYGRKFASETRAAKSDTV